MPPPPSRAAVGADEASISSPLLEEPPLLSPRWFTRSRAFFSYVLMDAFIYLLEELEVTLL